MKNKLLILFIVSVLFCCGCEFNSNDKSTVSEHYVAIDEYKVLRYKDNNWEVFREINNNSEQLNEYKVYDNNEYIKNYYFRLNNGVAYYFDNDFNTYDIDSNLAINIESNVEPIDYNLESFSSNDYEIVSNLLKDLKYSSYKDLSVFKKVSVNVDEDDEYESLYIISNYLNEDVYEDVFYIVFLRDKNKNYVIVDYDYDNMKTYDIGWFLNITKGKYCDIILKYDYMESYNYDVYQFINGKYELVVDEDKVIEHKNVISSNDNNYLLLLFVIFIILGLVIYLMLKKKGELRDRV